MADIEKIDTRNSDVNCLYTYKEDKLLSRFCNNDEKATHPP